VDINDWRIKIDELDAQLVALLNQRAQCAIEIGRIKRAQGLPVYSPARETQVIENVTQHNMGPLDNEAIRRLFERIIDEARRVERLAVGEHEE
jgi:chorismate mutase